MTATSVAMLVSAAAGQPQSAREIPVVSQHVGTSIDIAEEEYYDIFGDVRGFLSGQFQETPEGFEAVIRTKRRWIRRHYSAREFYDLGLAVDLRGPIDPEVPAELSGERVFDETAASMQELPVGVRMLIFQDGGRLSRGLYERFDGRHFVLKGRRGRLQRVPLEKVARIWYREAPVPDLKKDVGTYSIMALLGVSLAEGWNRLRRVNDPDQRWGNLFAGAGLGLGVSPFVVGWFRIQRAPVHTIIIAREARKMIDTYAFMTFQ